MSESLQQIHDRIAALERQVGALQDRHDIGSLIARYGPAVDSGDPTRTAELWSEAGTYSYPFGGETQTLQGRAGVHDMVLSDTHQGIIKRGAGHIMTAPAISLAGDTATAVCYSMLVRATADGGFDVWRLSSNRWEFVREATGWRVAARENHLLDGSASARALLELDCDDQGRAS